MNKLVPPERTSNEDLRGLDTQYLRIQGRRQGVCLGGGGGGQNFKFIGKINTIMG